MCRRCACIVYWGDATLQHQRRYTKEAACGDPTQESSSFVKSNWHHTVCGGFFGVSLSPPIIPSQLKVRCCCVVVRDAKVISVLISKLQRKQETYRKKEREQHTHRLLFVLCAASPKQTACSTRHRLHTRSGGVATLPLVASISHSRRHMTFFRSLCDYSVNIRRSALRCDGIYHAQSGARECTSASSVCITHARQKIW